MEKVKRTPASLKKMVETFGMEILHRGSDYDSAVITISDVNRPALQLVGFYDYFDDKRLQILGRGEIRYLERMTEAERLRVFNQLMSYPFPAMIVARNMEAPPELVQMADKHDRTLLRAVDSTVDITSRLIRHYIEIRGVGVIDVQQLFGMGAVQFDTEIDLVIQLEQWEDGKFYDRLGLGEEKYTMLDVSLPIVTIPVRPGRNLAGIVEIATMKNRQMKYGYNAARDFVTQFDSKVDAMLKKKSTTGEAENR